MKSEYPGFDLQRWRSAVEIVLHRHVTASEIICPFGFEQSRDISFLSRPIHRHYVYYRAPTELETIFPELIYDFQSALRSEQVPELTSIVLGTRGYPVVGSSGGGAAGSTLYLQYAAESSIPLLSEYGRYVSATPLLVQLGALPELASFQRRPSARRFIFQLLTIWHALWPSLVPCLSRDDELLCRRLAGQEGARDSTGNPVESSPQLAEGRMVENIVLPAARSIAHALAGADQVAVTIINTGERYKVRCNGDLLGEYTELVAKRYLEFVCGVKASREMAGGNL